jgi:hypothetical protein
MRERLADLLKNLEDGGREREERERGEMYKQQSNLPQRLDTEEILTWQQV